MNSPCPFSDASWNAVLPSSTSASILYPRHARATCERPRAAPREWHGTTGSCGYDPVHSHLHRGQATIEPYRRGQTAMRHIMASSRRHLEYWHRHCARAASERRWSVLSQLPNAVECRLSCLGHSHRHHGRGATVPIQDVHISMRGAGGSGHISPLPERPRLRRVDRVTVQPGSDFAPLPRPVVSHCIRKNLNR
jgi:hypothetical protein